MEFAANSAIEGAQEIDLSRITETSQPYVGRWNRLISTTNWEKGRIVVQWREALIGSEATVYEYSDDAWSRLVGGVTPQHVGRLRRVSHRFGPVHQGYSDLFWSHFQAAIDWDDAELWLEGAVQNNWSVSIMRLRRWETLGAVENERPNDREVVMSEPAEELAVAISDRDSDGVTSYREIETVPFVDEEPTSIEGASSADSADFPDSPARATSSISRPFEGLAELPDDLAEAFESFKLALLRHKTDGWQSISCDEVLAFLDALKEMASAPSENII